jgi:hypothetical protein
MVWSQNKWQECPNYKLFSAMQTRNSSVSKVIGLVTASDHRGSASHPSVHVGFVADKVALGQVYLQVLQFPLLITFHRSSTYSCIIWGMARWLLQFRDSLTPPTLTTTKWLGRAGWPGFDSCPASYPVRAISLPTEVKWPACEAL